MIPDLRSGKLKSLRPMVIEPSGAVNKAKVGSNRIRAVLLNRSCKADGRSGKGTPGKILAGATAKAQKMLVVIVDLEFEE